MFDPWTALVIGYLLMVSTGIFYLVRNMWDIREDSDNWVPFALIVLMVVISPVLLVLVGALIVLEALRDAWKNRRGTEEGT